MKPPETHMKVTVASWFAILEDVLWPLLDMIIRTILNGPSHRNRIAAVSLLLAIVGTMAMWLVFQPVVVPVGHGAAWFVVGKP